MIRRRAVSTEHLSPYSDERVATMNYVRRLVFCVRFLHQILTIKFVLIQL